MKRTKKQLSLFLVLIMALTVLNSFAARAETSITVTLRVEQDEATLITPVQVTLTDADKKDFGIGLDTDKLTPLHALAKYMTEKKGATEATMKQYIQASESQYGLFLEGIRADGTSSGSPAAGSQDGVSWMFAVNNTDPGVSVAAYELKENDSLVLYGIWSGGTWPDNEETNYSYFDQTTYLAAPDQALSVRLKGLGYDANYNRVIKDIEGATVIAAAGTDESSSATENNAVLTAKTDAKGSASLTFAKAGRYVLSAYRKAEDGTHYNISRPYAVVTVTEAGAANVVSSVTPVDTARGGTIWTQSFSTGSGTSCNSIPILGDTSLYVVNGSTLYELSYEDGRILRKVSLCAKMNSVCNMLLQDRQLYIPLSGGRMECVDTVSMTSRWQSESFGGQSLSTVFYHKGCLYAGTTVINAQGTAGVFYCLNAADGTTRWTYEDAGQPGGYYWSGGIVRDGALYFAGDNGILISHSLLDDTVYDRHILSETAKIRAGITYSSETDALYTVSTDGILYEIQISDQKVKSVNTCSIVPGADQIYTTSTPTIYNNRIYVGCLADRYGCVAVLDANKRQPVYQVKGPHLAEVKSSPLVSTRGDLSGSVYVYFSANAQPGGLYYFADDPKATEAGWQTLFTPAAAKQFCLSSITAGADGTLYYSNDSGTLFAVREVARSSDLPLPSPFASPAPAFSPTPAATLPPVSNNAIKKPKKPTKVKVKKQKKKIVLHWKKKTTASQTVVHYRYGKGKWKKTCVKKKSMCSLPVRKGKKIHIRLRSRTKIKGLWYYSGYTKTFHLKC